MGTSRDNDVIAHLKRIIVLALCLPFLLHGCAFHRLKGELIGASNLFVITGTVTSESADADARVVPVYSIRTSVPLDAPTFAPRYGQMGLWEPYTFLYEAAPGLYLLEPYDPDRIPVLFVHGAGGTPQDWRYFISHLDRTKYQAWVYYYASGLPLELNALYLRRMTDELHRMHAFDSLFVAGHSMGGLVAKRFIDMNITAIDPPYIGLFISIATPWGGVQSAKTGVHYAPVAIPSWVDISPESKFLRALYSQSSPRSVPHALFFAYGRDRVFRLTNTDGRVTLESQLEPRIKNSAYAIDGFNADHVGILHSDAAFERFSEIIDAASRRNGASVQPSRL